MKIIIIGSNSQIAYDFMNFDKNYTYLRFSRDELDITNIDLLISIFNKHNPDIILNFSAYTDVNKAEIDKENAYLINHQGLKNLAKISNNFNSYLIHISTDYVFDGNTKKPYLETDETNPQSVYGKSKLLGEREIINTSNKYFILRVSWLYGIKKNNFLTSIVNLLNTKNIITVVNDQFGLPTNTQDLCQILYKIIYKVKNGHDQSHLFHYSNSGLPISWLEYANYISICLKNYVNFDTKIHPIDSKSFFNNNIRPSFSALDSSKITKFLELNRIDWKVSVKKSIKLLYKKEKI